MTTIVANTTKDYPCIMCGSLGNIVREDAINPRLKCRNPQCGFMYDGKDSEELKRRGEIPDGLPDLPEEPVLSQPDSPDDARDSYHSSSNNASHSSSTRNISNIPRSPSHIIISKDRKQFEFVTDKDFKKKVLKWESSDKRYDVYQLMKFEYSVNIDLKN